MKGATTRGVWGHAPSENFEILVLSWLLEETGYEKRQTSMIRTTVLQFMLEVP